MSGKTNLALGISWSHRGNVGIIVDELISRVGVDYHFSKKISI